jgi:hypothetical protein
LRGGSRRGRRWRFWHVGAHIPAEVAFQHAVGFGRFLAPAVHVGFAGFDGQGTEYQPVVDRQGGGYVAGGVGAAGVVVMVLGRKHQDMGQRPHGFAHPGPAVVVEIQVVVPVYVGVGGPQALERGANHEHLHQPQVQAQQLEGVIGHDQPPGPAVHEGLGDGELAFVVQAAGHVVRAVVHLIEGLHPLQHPVIGAAAVGKQVEAAVNEFFHTEKHDQRGPEIGLLQPRQRSGAAGDQRGQAQGEQQQHQRSLHRHHHEGGEEGHAPVLLVFAAIPGAAADHLPQGGDHNKSRDQHRQFLIVHCCCPHEGCLDVMTVRRAGIFF